MKKYLYIIFILILSATGCQYFKLESYSQWKDSSNNQIKTDIYAAGFYSTTACYWKNGQRTDLPGNGATSPAVLSMFVSGSDVYCAGYGQFTITNALMWKNGTMQTINLTNPNFYSQINSIYVSSGVVYACGYENINAPASSACYWINGKEYLLKDPSGNLVDSQSNCIFVDKDSFDFYIAGYYTDSSSNPVPCYWKNGGNAITLTGITTTNNAYAASIFVSNGHIYICGYNTAFSGGYWIDGVFIGLNEYCYSIIEYQGDVFIGLSNSLYSAPYLLMKNNSPIYSLAALLISNSNNNLFIFDGTFYTSGRNSSTLKPCYFINDQEIDLDSNGNPGNAISIFVKQRS